MSDVWATLQTTLDNMWAGIGGSGGWSSGEVSDADTDARTATLTPTGGGDPISTVPCLGWYYPVDGDTVAWVGDASAALILGVYGTAWGLANIYGTDPTGIGP